MMKKYPISFAAGILAPVVYLVFTILAYFSFPMPFSPQSNWLSDLGNPELNPNGAVFYNTGIIVTALLLIIFFLGLSVWKIEDHRIQRVMLKLTQVFGVLGSLFMALSAIFPINNYEMHAFWSTCLYIMLSTAFIFSAATLRYHNWVPRWLILIAIFSAVLVISTAFLQSVYLLEWITVSIFLLYVILLGVETRKQYSFIQGGLLLGEASQ
jgi:hypothetical membrane protein